MLETYNPGLGSQGFLEVMTLNWGYKGKWKLATSGEEAAGVACAKAPRGREAGNVLVSLENVHCGWSIEGEREYIER